MPSAPIRFHGSVPGYQVSAAIDTCDLFLITSKTEGQCLVALEVLARGRPLVATPVGALPDMLDDARLGGVVEPSSTDQFARAIHDLADRIKNRELTPEIVRQAYEKKYSCEVVRQGYLAILRDLLATDTTAGIR